MASARGSLVLKEGFARYEGEVKGTARACVDWWWEPDWSNGNGWEKDLEDYLREKLMEDLARDEGMSASRGGLEEARGSRGAADRGGVLHHGGPEIQAEAWTEPERPLEAGILEALKGELRRILEERGVDLRGPGVQGSLPWTWRRAFSSLTWAEHRWEAERRLVDLRLKEVWGEFPFQAPPQSLELRVKGSEVSLEEELPEGLRETLGTRPCAACSRTWKRRPKRTTSDPSDPDIRFAEGLVFLGDGLARYEGWIEGAVEVEARGYWEPDWENAMTWKKDLGSYLGRPGAAVRPAVWTSPQPFVKRLSRVLVAHLAFHLALTTLRERWNPKGAGSSFSARQERGRGLAFPGTGTGALAAGGREHVRLEGLQRSPRLPEGGRGAGSAGGLPGFRGQEARVHQDPPRAGGGRVEGAEGLREDPRGRVLRPLPGGIRPGRGGGRGASGPEEGESGAGEKRPGRYAGEDPPPLSSLLDEDEKRRILKGLAEF